MAEDVPSLLDMARSLMVPLGPKCAVQEAIESKPELATQITELVDSTKGPGIDGPGIRFSVASAVLKKVGLEIKPDTISRHRRGECACRP